MVGPKPVDYLRHSPFHHIGLNSQRDQERQPQHDHDHKQVCGMSHEVFTYLRKKGMPPAPRASLQLPKS